MKLEVIGSSCGGPRGGQPAAGYVVHAGEDQVLLDCGPGVATALTRGSLARMSAIVISHGHYDHTADLVILGTCLTSLGELPGNKPMPVYFPPGTLEPIVTYAHSYPFFVGKNLRMFDHVFAATEYEPGKDIHVGNVRIAPTGPTEHPLTNWALRVTDGRTILTYSGDSAYSERLIEAARGSDLFLCDAYGPDFGHPSHMSAEEAGKIAGAAGVKSLLLTHVMEHSAEYRRRLVESARRYYSGPIDVAQAGVTYTI